MQIYVDIEKLYMKFKGFITFILYNYFMMDQSETQNEIQEYLNKMKNLQKNILSFVEKESTIQNDYHNIIKFIADNNIHEDRYDLKALLHLLSSISNNHHRNHDFFKKIEHIFIFLKESITKFYSNYQIFQIFQDNKRMLLFLFEQKIIIPDEFIASIITKDKYINQFYPEYFYPEFKAFFNKETCQKIESRNHKYKKISEFVEKNPESFEQKRKNGENDGYVCQLIRNDLIDQFIKYVNKNKLTFSEVIKPSIYETNPFLLNKNTSFIEYSALFGSVLIFRFLCLNEIDLTPSLWLFAIHGRNFELTRQLEEEEINPSDTSYKECFFESIKCHHLHFANYFKNKINNIEKIMDINEQFIKYYNYEYISNDLDNSFVYFYDLCQYDYYKIVQSLLKTTKLNLNSKRISIIKIVFISF